MDYFDQHPFLYVLVVVLIGCVVCTQLSSTLFQLAKLARRWATGTGRWASRPAAYKAVGIVAGLFAVFTIVILAWTDQNILSFSFFVLFPGDKVMRFLAGLAYTLCEIMVGHLCAEAIGFTRLYLDRLFSPRQRAILFLFFSVALGILLSNEYSLAFRRAILMAAQTVDSSTALDSVQQPASAGASAETVAAAHASGLVAFAVGLADVVIGFTLAAAMSVIADIFDGLARVGVALASILLRLAGIVILGASRLLKFPARAIESLRRSTDSIRDAYMPLSVYRKVRRLEPAIERGSLTYADARELLRLAAELDRKDLAEDEWNRTAQRYNALVEDCLRRQRRQTAP